MRKGIIAVVVTGINLLGCADTIEPPDTRAPLQLSVQPMPRHLTTDEEYREIARRVPGFAGFFFDEDGEPTMYLKDPRGKEAAKAWLQDRAEAGKHRAITDVSWRVRVAAYDYEQLTAWLNSLSGLPLGAKVAFTDIDEANNRINIGILNAGFVAATEGALERIGIPRGAFNVEVVGETTRLQSDLRSTFRPFPSGVLITNSAGSECTVGPNFYWPSRNSYYFQTNSHCSTVDGARDGGFFYQPSGETIGYEDEDKSYSSPCMGPDGRLWGCKYSDAALIRAVPSSNVQYADIAKTSTNLCVAECTLSIDPSTPRFDVEGTNSNSSVGERLHKMGASSGWSDGLVKRTCVNQFLFESGIPTDKGLWCQTSVSAFARKGDSGSPVFIRTDGNDVRIRGILWGITSNTGEFWFSPKSGVNRDYNITDDGAWLFHP